MGILFYFQLAAPDAGKSDSILQRSQQLAAQWIQEIIPHSIGFPGWLAD